MTRQAILYLSTKCNAWSIEAFDALQKVKDADVLFAYHQMGEELPKVLEGLNTFCFTDSILHDLGYSPIEGGILPGSNHFPLLKFYRDHPNNDYYWMVEDDVRFSGEWNDFFKEYADNSSDFLSAYVTSYQDAPNWYWWYTLETGKEDIPKDKWIKSFNPIYHLSNKALQCIDTHLRQGWKGHHECLIPTLLDNKGFSIEDFGGEGIFVKDTNKKRYYDEETFGLRPVLPDNNRKNMLFHPVKEEEVAAPTKNNCVFVPTGDNSLHRQLLQEEADFDLHLLIYDKSYNKWCNDTAYIGADSGYKMDMTYRYLQRHPEYLEHYEYFFLMDDDIEMSTEEVNKLFRYMRKYHLRIAQPSLVMSYYTYEHTLHNPTCILRYTNFVEMMMPCFSQEALKLVLPTFEKKVRWMGIEWHWASLITSNHRDMAIIDDIKAIHGKPLQSWSEECDKLMQEFLNRHNLSKDIIEFSYLPNNFGLERDKYKEIRNHFNYTAHELFHNKSLLTITLTNVVLVCIFLLLMVHIMGKRKCLDVFYKLTRKTFCCHFNDEYNKQRLTSEIVKLKTFILFFLQQGIPIQVEQNWMGKGLDAHILTYDECFMCLDITKDYPNTILNNSLRKCIEYGKVFYED